MWQTLIAAVLAAILIKSLDWLPKLLPVARGGVSRLSGVVGQWWSGFLCGGVAVAIVAVLIGGAKLPSIDWPDWIPTPAPSPEPIPATGFRVVFIRETGDKPTQEQLAIYGSSKITAYLNEKCAKIDGRAEWRKWDKDVDVTHETELWKKLWETVKPKATSLPSIAIVTDRIVKVEPLPATEEATLALLKKYGG